MYRYKKSALLAGLVLLLSVACTGYPPPSPPYDPPPPSYDPPPPSYDPPSHSSSDERIHDRVHRALERAPSLRGLDIGVRVHHHNVYLSGKVYSHDQKRAAHDVAHAVDGVRRVFTRDIYVY